MSHISWSDFDEVDLRSGTIIKAEEFPEARKPAYKIQVNMGEQMAINKSSAQVTDLYRPDDLIGKQVVCIVNFPPKQIDPLVSKVQVTGIPDENDNVVMTSIEHMVPNGLRLF